MVDFARVALEIFSTDQTYYANAVVTVHLVEADGTKSDDLATLYGSETGDDEVENPVQLGSRGQWPQDVYVDGPVIMAISGLSTAPDHDLPILGNVAGEALAQAVAAADQARSFYELTRRLVAQFRQATISAFSFSLFALSTAGDWLTALGVSNFGKTLIDDVDAAAGRTTLGAAASAITITGTKSITGGGDLTANRTLELDGDEATPGALEFYGTDAGGAKRWLALLTAHLPAGVLVDYKIATVTAASTLTGNIPADDTIPQSGEGNLVATLSHAAKKTTNKLVFIGLTWGSLVGSIQIIQHAIFKDTETDAFAASGGGDTRNAANGQGQALIIAEHIPGDTNSHDYKFRVGAAGSNFNINSVGGATRMFGGVGLCAYLMLEIQA